MQTLHAHPARKAVSKPLLRANRRAAPQAPTVQMVVRVATRDAETARRALHFMLGSALGIHTVDIDRRSDLACLHVELERTRVGEAMALLIRTVSCAEFGTIRKLERI